MLLLLLIALHPALAQTIDFNQQELDWIKNHPQITVGMDDRWPPIDFVNSSGQHQGISIDILQLIASHTGIQFIPKVEDSWQDMLNKSAAREIDIVATLAQNSNRKETWDFTEPYFQFPYVITVRKQDDSIIDLNSLSGKTVAMEKGYFLQQELARHPMIKLLPVESTIQALEAVSREQADAYIGNQTVIFYLMEQSRLTNLKVAADAGFPVGKLHFGIRKDWPELVTIINKVLAATPSRQLKMIERNWLGFNQLNNNSLIPPVNITFTPEEKQWLLRHPNLKVGVMDNWPPFNFINEKGLPDGIGVEIIQLINQRLDHPLTIVPDKWADIYQRVVDKKLDIIMDITARTEREKNFNFTQPYLDIPHIIIARRNSENINDENDLLDKTLALEQGFGNVGYFEKNYPSVKLKFYADTEQALEAVSREEADAYAGNRVVALHLLEKLSLNNLKVHGRLNKPGSILSLGTRKDYPILRNILQKVLNGIGDEPIREIKNNWIYDPDQGVKSNLVLSKKLTDWLKSHPSIKAGIDTQWQPLEYLDDQGHYQGLSSDFIKHFVKQIGIKLEPPDNIPWSQVLEGLREKSIDIAPLLISTEERRQFLNFTKPYLTFPVVIFNQRGTTLLGGMSDLSEKKVGMVEGYAIAELIRRDQPNIQQVMFKDTLSGLQALATGQIDAYIDVLSVGAYLIASNGMSNLQVAASTPYQHDFSIGVRKDWPELVSILNYAIDQLPVEKKNEFLKKWLVVKYQKEIDYTLLFWVLAVALIIFLLLSFRAREMGRINAKLTEGRERLALTLEAAELGTFELRFRHNAGPLFFYDETFARHHSLREQIEFRDVDEFFRHISLEHADKVRQQLRLYIKGEIDQFRVEYQNSRNYHWISVQGRIFEREASGWAQRIIGISQDINERKEAQIAMEKSSQFKSQFLANMSHEIRTPMNAIVGLGHLLSTSGLNEKQSGYVNTLQKSAKILLGLIDDILDFSKIEAGHLRIDPVEFNLEDLLKDLADMTALRITQENLEFIIDIGNDLPRNLVGDSFRLNQVLNNLISNAIKFTEQGNIILKVHLETQTPDQVMLMFSVTDSGIGIDKKNIDRLFEPFIQEDGSTTRRYGGTGLGLSISKQLTRLMGGDLHAESDQGKGSRFYFTLPFKLVKADHQVLLSPPSTDLRNMRVLIADDNPTSLEILTDTLSSLSFRVSSVNSGKQAIQTLVHAREEFDILLIDWRMPDQDGISTTAEIRNTLATERMPLIILMTAYGKDAIELDSAHLQLDGILIKPITPSSLFNAIIHARKNALSEEGGSTKKITASSSVKPLSGHIILAEDNPINQQVAQEILQQMGIRVTVCENGTQVLQALENTIPDLILMDIQMPQMDGYETTRIIRAKEQFANLPIVAMTANAMKEDIQKSLDVGMQGHISKPVNPDLLYQTLAQHLDVKQSKPEVHDIAHIKDPKIATSWPAAIPGLNIERGIKQVGGNESLYQKLLTEFLHNNQHLRKDLNLYIQQGNLEQATRSVHTLKGVSGNIGAERLYTISSEIDSKLKKGKAVDHSLLDEFSQAYNELCQGIKQLQSDQNHPPVTPANTPPDPDLQQLLDALIKNDASSRSLLNQLHSTLEQTIAAEKLQHIDNLVQDYEFEQAAQELQRQLKGSDDE